MAKPDIVLCTSVRTPIATYGGALKDTPATDLGAAVIDADHLGLDPAAATGLERQPGPDPDRVAHICHVHQQAADASDPAEPHIRANILNLLNELVHPGTPNRLFRGACGKRGFGTFNHACGAGPLAGCAESI